ncbi:O-antigen ligase family protein [Cryobacterium zhongshanensis]|uniref:O-antigen ligase family protein n=1 Tax=Cryobacterium zhongshanensis TaxID=2928153 RepID=A0AA41UFK9_9MICO|nr:O-antigen ligase family protein [Cryobacterium zhongshanensis]MCI4658237.1 O-antigen ligase family protein [Cryobacterium zhongshanensis]
MLIVLSWLFGFLTNLFKVLQDGRVDRIVVSNDAAATGVVRVFIYSFLIAVIVLAAIIIVDNVSAATPSTKLWMLGVALLPFVVILFSDLANGEKPASDVAVYPLVVFALWRARVAFRTLRVLGWITVVSALVSIGMGFVLPSIGTTLPPIIGDKVYWPTLLAGPYSHPNVLGLALSMGLPFVFLIHNRFALIVGILSTLFAVGWSGNRCSMLAAAIAILVFMLVRWRPETRLRPLAILAVGAYLTCVIPVMTTDTADYSLRGQIWIESLKSWRDSPVFGHGSGFYFMIGQYSNSFGPTAFNGHNAFVHLLATGGLLLLAAVVLFMVTVYRSGRNLPVMYRAVTMSFSIMLVYNAWLQNTITFTGLSEIGYIGWLPMALILFASAKPSALAREALVDTEVGEAEEIPTKRPFLPVVGRSEIESVV